MEIIFFLYIILLVFALFFGIKKISELSDRLTTYHEREGKIKRVMNVFRIYVSMGLITFFVMYITLTLDIVQGFFNGNKNVNVEIILITIFSSAILLFVTRLCSLCPRENLRDKEKHKERIASFCFALISTLFFTLIIFLGSFLYLRPDVLINFDVIPLDQFFSLGLVWVGVLLFLTIIGEIILSLGVPYCLKSY